MNNVGVLHGTPLYLSEMSESDVWDMINVNIGAMSMMTRIVLPSMLRRQRGIIVNLSSISSMQPLPLMGIYAASKVQTKPSINSTSDTFNFYLINTVFFVFAGIHRFSFSGSQ